MRLWTISAAAVVLAVCAAGARGQRAFPVRADAVRLQEVERVRPVTGSIVSYRESLVAGEEDGLVQTAEFDEGDRVEAGSVLAELNSDLLVLQLEESRADLRRNEAMIAEYEAELTLAEWDLQSLRDLSSQGAAKAKEIADVEAEVAIAAARVEVARMSVALAQAAVARIQRQVDGTVIRAPFDGYVVEKHVEVGQWVDRGGPIARIVEAGVVDALLDVPETSVDNITIGAELRIELTAVAADEIGRVRSIRQQGDARARTYPVRVTLNDHEGLIRPGMSVRGWVPVGGREERLTIHRDAVLRSDLGPYVYAVRGEQVFPVNISIDGSAGDGRLILAGESLQAGDLVVVEGNERLFPTAPVQVLQDTADGG